MAARALHCFARSGNAFEAALLPELAGTDRSPRFADCFSSETRTPACRERNVIGEVPEPVPVPLHRWLMPSRCGYLHLAGEFGEDWSTLPALRDWLARIAATPRWKHPYSLMPGHPRRAAA